MLTVDSFLKHKSQAASPDSAGCGDGILTLVLWVASRVGGA